MFFMQAFEYFHKAWIGIEPIWALVVSAIVWLLFPEKSVITVGYVLLAMIVLDVLTKMYALKKTNRKFTSNSFWEGTLPKIIAFGVVFILSSLAIRLDEFLSPIGKTFAILAYGTMFIREIKSIDENLSEAGNKEFHKLISFATDGIIDKIKGLFGIEISFMKEKKTNKKNKK